jgi:hypothetical protein
MKLTSSKSLLGTLLLAAGLSSPALALEPGDITFSAFNGNGVDDIAFVTLVDLPANTTLYFTDAPWDGSKFDLTKEGDMTWSSGANTIPAGTVISINALDGTTTVSQGSLTLDNSGGFSPKADAMFVFEGSAPRVPTKFLGVIGNSATAFTTLNGTGLSLGTTAIVVPGMIAQYKGPRSGLNRSALLAALGDVNNWETQADGTVNAEADGIGPDVPFNSTKFSISAGDNTPPTVANALFVDDSTINLVLTEGVTTASAQNLANYTTTLGTIQSATLQSDTKTVRLVVAGLTAAKRFKITVNGLVDLASNTMTQAWTSGDLVYNASKPKLAITEIMYNPPGTLSDALEYIEITNLGSTAADLGGLRVKDEANFDFVMPDSSLAPGAVLLLANNKTTADGFYGKTFVSLGTAGNSNVLGNGGETLVIRNSKGEIIDSVFYDDAGEWPLSADGQGTSLELRNPNLSHNLGNNWQASKTNTGLNTEGFAIYASPGVFSPVVTPQISFATDYSLVSKATGSAKIAVKLSAASTDSVKIRVRPQFWQSAVQNTDVNVKDTLWTIAPGKTADTLSLSVQNTVTSAEKTFGLVLDSAVNAELGAIKNHLVYLRNSAIAAPSATDSLQMKWLSSYKVDSTGSSEIVAYHQASKRLFVLNSTKTKVEILDFTNPKSIAPYKSIDMSVHGIGATSIAVHGDKIAATVDAGPEANGKVVLMDSEGNVKSVLEVGNLPDMVTFSPDGRWVLTANEGQPKTDYTVDAEGSISMIDVSGGITGLTSAQVSTLDFKAFNSKKDSLVAKGLRVFGVKGGASTLAEDLEPEYITVSEDSKKAWVTLQENNALAEIDLVAKSVTRILPLGYKDHSAEGNALDASDKTTAVLMANWPVFGAYMPDAMAQFKIGDKTYLITANEGDAREYDALKEEAKVGDASYILDPVRFPNAQFLKSDKALGRLAVSGKTGDDDKDGDFDRIISYGARSVSIWDAETGALVWDSGSDLERITATDATWSGLFNVSNDNNTFKNRSDNKGPEPEGVTVATIRGKTYAFIALERTGGVVSYDISNPSKPVFVSYSNNRTIPTVGGDLGPEGIIYIPAEKSPIDSGLVVIANEVSATISVYTTNETKPVIVGTLAKNPTIQWQQKGNLISINAPTSVKIWNLQGQLVLDAQETQEVSIDKLSQGVYWMSIGENNLQTLFK